jgi:hypothetical protein
MCTLNVPALRGNLSTRLNNQYLVSLRMRFFHRTNLTIELITHHPDGLLVHTTIV